METLLRDDHVGPSPFAPSVHIGFNQRALGDSVATLPAIAFALQQYPETHFQVWPPDYMVELVERALAPWPNKTVKGLSRIQAEADISLPAAMNKFKEGYSTLKTPLVEYAYRCLLDMDPPTAEDKNYLQPPVAPLPDRLKTALGDQPYVVFTTNYTSRTRVFTPEVAHPIIDYVLARGHRPVFLGQKAVPVGGGATIGTSTSAIDTSRGLSLLDETTLVEAHSVLAGARAVVGVDNGLLHLAAMTDVPIVAGFTNVAASTREPHRHGTKSWRWSSVEPPKTLKCAPCQSKWHYCYNVKFTECPYEDYACNRLDPQEFISALQSFGV